MSSINRQLALSLLHADSEDEVIELLTHAGYWTDPNAWRLLGDKDGNFSTIGNQQARPDAALVEKIVNSVDARLMNACLERGIDPEGDSAPASIKSAIAKFFGGGHVASEGSLADWSSSQTLDEARLVTVAVTGKKPREGRPCITICDRGEGQTPGRFPSTFLSIDKANKLRIPFVQGKFNMGGTGALKFCGTHSLQLVVSKRNPAILKSWRGTKWAQEDPRADEWGFTVVRRELPSGAKGDVRNSVFRYLAPLVVAGEKSVLSFSAEELVVFPERNKPYARRTPYGTAIKLYENDMKGMASHALRKGGLLAPVEALLPEIALPVRMHECREYRGEEARSFANNVVGFTVRVGESSPDPGQSGPLEQGYPDSASFVVRGERMTARIYAFKDNKADNYRTNEGIIFSINGQTHGAIPKTFFERKAVKMGRLARSLIVLVDCSQMSVGAREDLFMNSRDRLSNGGLRKEIEDELQDLISQHRGLRELRERRRREEIQDRIQESKPLEAILDSIFKSSPTLSRLFAFGQRLSRPNKSELDPRATGGGIGQDGGTAPFAGRPHPTYFRFAKKKPAETLHRNAEIGRRCRIRFETDAQNDYFERVHHAGFYEVEVLDGPLDGLRLDHNLSLHNGIANWSINLPEGRIEVGDQLTLQFTVGDPTLVDNFVNIAVVRVMPHEVRPQGEKGARASSGSGGKRDDSGSGDEGSHGSGKSPGASFTGGISIPDIVQVTRGDANWVSHRFDDATACHVVDDGDAESEPRYVFYVNVDNVHLATEMKDSREDVAVLRTKYVWANVLIGLALLHDDRNRSEEDQLETVYHRIRGITKALSPFVLPMIEYLGNIEEEQVLAASAGDDE